MSALADFAHKFGSSSREVTIGQSFFLPEPEHIFHTIRCKFVCCCLCLPELVSRWLVLVLPFAKETRTSRRRSSPTSSSFSQLTYGNGLCPLINVA